MSWWDFLTLLFGSSPQQSATDEQPPETASRLRRLALDAGEGVTSGNSTQEEETRTMRLTAIAHHLMPFVALAGGILVLLMPRLLNYVVAVYLILVGSIGLNSLFHFFR